MLNPKKNKKMIFNFTSKYKFSTRLKLDEELVETVSDTRLLGTIIQENLSLGLNTANIVKKANARMEILRRVASFGASVSDMKDIYILFVRSLLEQSATVWHSSLSQQNINDLERVQKSALKIILGQKYTNYENSLSKLDILSLSERREQLCLQFALKCTKNPKTKHMFPENFKRHEMKTRNREKYLVQHAHTGRLRNSSIIYMQHQLNDHAKTIET